MILGAVLAGGESKRFGGDKALAELGGKALIERAIDALAQYCPTVIVVGRSSAPVPTIPDWPANGMGPLGGIAAALRHARGEGYESVLTCGVDSVLLPPDLLESLSPAPACIASQPVIGHWSTTFLHAVEKILASEEQHSMVAFANAIGARKVLFADTPANINTFADLAAVEARLDL